MRKRPEDTFVKSHCVTYDYEFFLPKQPHTFLGNNSQSIRNIKKKRSMCNACLLEQALLTKIQTMLID